MADKQTDTKKAKGGALLGVALLVFLAVLLAVLKEGGEAPKAKALRERADYVARLRTHYDKVVRVQLTEKFGYKNPMQVPMITKVVLNMGIGEGVAARKKVDNASQDLSLIAGQKSDINKSRKSLAYNKLRDGQAIGTKVTLRK